MRRFLLRNYLFILPSLLLVAVFSYFPTASAVYHSFFRWSGSDEKTFVGLSNFLRMFADGIFWESFITIGILVVANLLKMTPSIAIAVLIHRTYSERLQYIYRVLVVVPMVVPGIVTLFIWKFFYDPNIGPLNELIDALGLKPWLVAFSQAAGLGMFEAGQPIGWLNEPELVLFSLIIWGFPWLGAFGVLVYLAGLQAIDAELYEAARLDGANTWQQFRHIELPLIMTQIRLTFILQVIATLQGYGHIFLLLGENGGPGAAAMVPGLWMFNRAFYAGEFGYACALGLAVFLAIMMLTWINNRFLRVDK